MIENRELLNKIIVKDDTSKLLVFTHDEKVWVMPECAVKGGMDMYQPSSKKGRILKKRIEKKHSTPIFAKGSNVEIINADIQPNIRKQIEELLGISDFYVAIYMGELWTSQNNKATLQIYSDKEIYAYIKATTDIDNMQRIKNEADNIDKLRKLGVECIPKVIGLDLDSEVKMFAQSTDKPFYQDTIIRFDEELFKTINQIVDSTKTEISYKDTDYCEYTDFLKNHLALFDQDQKSIIEEAIQIIEEGEINEYSFSHGDFTPWNTYYINDELKMFDLEYASWSMPPFIDIFHYLSQSALLGQRYTAQCVMREYERKLDLIKKYVDNPKFTFICYLVWVISFYIKRAENNIDRIENALDVWVEMLEYLIKYL